MGGDGEGVSDGQSMGRSKPRAAAKFIPSSAAQ